MEKRTAPHKHCPDAMFLSLEERIVGIFTGSSVDFSTNQLPFPQAIAETIGGLDHCDNERARRCPPQRCQDRQATAAQMASLRRKLRCSSAWIGHPQSM
jgi:hypothetical protein